MSFDFFFFSPFPFVITSYPKEEVMSGVICLLLGSESAGAVWVFRLVVMKQDFLLPCFPCLQQK